MRKEVERWINLASDDFRSAEINFDNKLYYVAVFLCQQTVEKALKSVLIKKTNQLIKIHDLITLGKKVGLPEDLIKKCDKLNNIYLDSRYGDIGEDLPSKKFKKTDSLEFLKITREILEWSKKNI